MESPRPLLSVIMPVYNEMTTLPSVLAAVLALPLDLEVFVIDNVSTDGTREYVASLAGKPRLRAVHQHTNYGKGSSVRVGLALARGEFVVVQDADLEYDPTDLVRLVEVARESAGAAVFGSRLLGRRPAVPWHHALGRDALNWLFTALYRARLTDVATCYKLMPLATARALPLESLGFDLDYELPCRLRRAGVSIVEVPVSYRPRTIAEGKKLRWTDGITALSCLLRYASTQPDAHALAVGQQVVFTAPPFEGSRGEIIALPRGGVTVRWEWNDHEAEATVTPGAVRPADSRD